MLKLRQLSVCILNRDVFGLGLGVGLGLGLALSGLGVGLGLIMFWSH